MQRTHLHWKSYAIMIFRPAFVMMIHFDPTWQVRILSLLYISV